MTQPLILASRSPQRAAILEQLGVDFEVRPAAVEELGQGDPEHVARQNALAKARASAVPGRLTLGVDTIVAVAGRLHGKPRDEAHARALLEGLSGREHQVWSAVALLRDGEERLGVATTAVSFRELTATMLDWYLASGEWRERAGAYAIQGKGAAFVLRIDGDYWNVVGLPVALLLDLQPNLPGLLPA
jgi:nucleoside triphosphate pyrophosphatase